MKIIFRTDSSSQIGSGHVMRCLTLADALSARGAACLFVCREHEGHLMGNIRSRGHAVHALPENHQENSSSSNLAHSSWLGAGLTNDAHEMRYLIGHKRFDWLIVDHYAVDYRWEQIVRPACKYLMVIDDLADRAHSCDLLLDQNCGRSHADYASQVRSTCVKLIGPKFALINPVYRKRRTQIRYRSGEIKRALIYFGGGSDSAKLVPIAMRAFEAPELRHIELDIVAGPNCSDLDELNAAAVVRGRVLIHTQLPDLSELIATADLAIGAAGATTWERCCLGLPSVLVVCAQNQNIIGEAMNALGAAIVLHPNENLTANIRNCVVNLMADTPKYLAMSDRSKAICDGLGVRRIIKSIYGIQESFYA